MAIRFAKAGASLYLVDINETRLSEAANEVRSEFGINVSTYRVDLSRKKEIDGLWNSIKGKESDILVNNAGVYEFVGFLEVNEEALKRSLSVKPKVGLLHVPKMTRGRGDEGGMIINIGSIKSILPFVRNLVHYDMSKMGVIAFTRTFAKEYGPRGIILYNLILT